LHVGVGDLAQRGQGWLCDRQSGQALTRVVGVHFQVTLHQSVKQGTIVCTQASLLLQNLAE
jgi:hypothetical protein